MREYLDKMKGLSIDEIVNSSALHKSAAKDDNSLVRNSRITPDKSVQGEGIFSGVASPMPGSVRGAPSHMSIITPKQVSIVENIKANAQSMALNLTGKPKDRSMSKYPFLYRTTFVTLVISFQPFM